MRKIRFINIFVLGTFLFNSFGSFPVAKADEDSLFLARQAEDFILPEPGALVHLSPEFNPPILKGLKVHPDNPFRFDFILDQGDDPLRQPGDMASAVSLSRLPSKR